MTDATNPSPARIAIVTGGGGGMGAGLARELHVRGYGLTLMSPSSSAETLAAEIGGLGITGAVEAAAELARLVAATVERFGRVDSVANHTGHSPKGDLLDILDAGWERGNAMMVLSVGRMARLVTPLMLAQGGAPGSTSPPSRPSSPPWRSPSPPPIGRRSAPSPSSTPTATGARASA